MAATGTASSWRRVLGANDDVRVAVVGFNGQGKRHIEAFGGMPGVRRVALCDADRDVMERAAHDLRGSGKAVDGHQDVRKVLDDRSIDAVSTATPNHWHALLTVCSQSAADLLRLG